MTKPLEFSINNVNKDVSFLTTVDEKWEQTTVRLTEEQYNAVADVVWWAVEGLLASIAVENANKAVIADAVADEVITPEQAEEAGA